MATEIVHELKKTKSFLLFGKGKLYHKCIAVFGTLFEKLLFYGDGMCSLVTVLKSGHKKEEF